MVPSFYVTTLNPIIKNAFISKVKVLFVFYIYTDKPIQDTQIRLWRAVFLALCIDFREKADLWRAL